MQFAEDVNLVYPVTFNPFIEADSGCFGGLYNHTNN
jgi:hypothetical protein